MEDKDIREGSTTDAALALAEVDINAFASAHALAKLKMSVFVFPTCGVAPSIVSCNSRRAQRLAASAKALDVDVNLAPPTTRIAPRVPEGAPPDFTTTHVELK